MPPTGNRPTCQLYGKYGHFVSTCGHRFNENCMPPNTNTTQPNFGGNTSMSQEKPEDSSQNSQVMVMMVSTIRPLVTTQEYCLPAELKS